MFLTETWQQNMDYSHLIELCPADCSFISTPRLTGRGGGLAVVFKDKFTCQMVSTESYCSFELQISRVGRLNPIYCILIYRQPGPIGSFLSDFTDFLSSIIKLDRVLMVGDFNLHIDNTTCNAASEFLNLTESFDFNQHVSGSTHTGGHTLDLVFTHGIDIKSVGSKDFYVSDHKCILFDICSTLDSEPSCHMRQTRIINEAVTVNFSTVFDSNMALKDGDVDTLVKTFNTHCSSVLDKLAPLKLRKISKNPSPWINESIRTLRRKCRKTERLWKATKLEVHRLHLKGLMATLNNMVKAERSSFFANLISVNKRNPKVLFDTVNHIVSPSIPKPPILSNSDCNNFLKYFIDKVANIRANISPMSSSLTSGSSTPSILDSFCPVSIDDIAALLGQMKPSSSPLDVLPTTMFLKVFNCIGPCVANIINRSLLSGCVPRYFKQAIVQPLLKKSNLDASLPENYRPISKLPFFSKILEKTVEKQLVQTLELHRVFDRFQSGFRKLYSTETALLKVSNDILMAADAGDCSVLVLLDLSAAFDTVDHHILIQRLDHLVGISGTALEWFSSYLTDRSLSVSVGEFVSDTAALSCGVPQGSVLGPILFSIYMLPLGQIISSFKNISYHMYADDIQLYFSFKPNELHKLSVLNNCLNAIRNWMANNFLQLNADKTEVLIFGPENLQSSIRQNLGTLSSSSQLSLRNLGVIFDQSMSFEAHVKTLTRSCFFHLRNIAKLRSVVSRNEMEMLIHAFISSRLDYCNSLFTCLNKSSIHRLQTVQNAAARLLTQSNRWSHITPILTSLHWLPVNFRIHFKILVLTYRALHGQAPQYITDLLHPYTTSRALRSSTQGFLSVPRTHFKTRGDHAFQSAAPKLWNSLPTSLRALETVDSFKKQLKTHLFRQAFG